MPTICFGFQVSLHLVSFEIIKLYVLFFFEQSLILMNYFCLISFLLISLSLQCHVSCVPVFDSMSRKEIKPWGVVVTLSMIICLFVYTGTGIISVCDESHIN